MKRLALSIIGVAVIGAAAVWAAVEIQQTRTPELASLMPDGALLYLESSDFRSLLSDWNESQEKRAWLAGDNYQAFSRSRLWARLSQAGDEFSGAASITTDDSMLRSVAGHQSALALYDIGELKFVYITRMEQHEIESSPLWQVRNHFEQRAAGTTPFYVHTDQQSNRTAVFAARDGYLIVGTSEELVAGVLDRMQGSQAHSLTGDSWYTDSIKLAHGPAGNLRMVLDLEKLVPSPYFRSYWVQRNITEMKQYRAALSDLRRGSPVYREERFLLRKANATARSYGDVLPIAAIVPAGAVFYSAHASPDADSVVSTLQENLLELEPSQARALRSAPAAAAEDNAGSASQLEERIDVAPVIVTQADPYQTLRSLVGTSQPVAMLTVYCTRAPRESMFVSADRAVVLQAATPWELPAVQSALTAALRPGLTASGLGIGWAARSGPSGSYVVLDGRLALALAVRGKRLLLASSESLLDQLLAASDKPANTLDPGVTYVAELRHSVDEQSAFRRLFERLDKSTGGGQTAASSDDDSANGRQPAFFSGNIDSLNGMFAGVASESITEKDQGSQVVQLVEYTWLPKK